MEKDAIRKLYIEPTARCNLNCAMCPRNAWFDEEIGEMEQDLFLKLIDQAKEIPTLETIFFGGVAEPMSNPSIYNMVERAKSLNVRVELITNGSYLNKDSIEKLLRSGLDMLWVSVDTAHADSIAEDGAENIDSLKEMEAKLLVFNIQKRKINPQAELGIAFVAMKSNMDELPEIIRMGQAARASEIKISNVIPYNKAMEDEMLYVRSLTAVRFKENYGKLKRTLIHLPVMDFELLDKDLLSSILNSDHALQIGESGIFRKTEHCRFVQNGNLFVRWDGEVSPCIALLHNNVTYLHGDERKIKHFSFGNVKMEHLLAIWDSDEYLNFRKRVIEFSFSPCTICGGCNYTESNEEDCFGNSFPTCGGCLWPEGFAQCP
jgi:MoaA/NifB/PqqE/SkfB family radical SAM enzyme